jgi:(1->4)-alpha-D-glucan 1-alpha-D-glucosylmutase
MVLAPRLVMKLAGDWGNTTVIIPVGDWRNQLTNSVVNSGKQRLADVFGDFPVALLARE